MSEVQITIEGEDTITATQELLAIPGISGKLEIFVILKNYYPSPEKLERRLLK